MPITPADIALGVFTVCNTARVFAYLPQIVKIGRDTQGATAISYTTWALFGVSHLSTVTYAVLVVDDWRMAAVFAANTLCCLVILGLTAWKRAVFKAARKVIEAAVPSTEHADRADAPRVPGATLTNRSCSYPFRLRVVSDQSGPS
jgi:uncharacterized protein with PQ loop repeat